jgi:hypothetical protein
MFWLPRIWVNQLPQLWKGRIDPGAKWRKIKKLHKNHNHQFFAVCGEFGYSIKLHAWISVCKRIYVSWYIYLLCFDNWQKCICMWSEGLQCKKKKISRQFKFWVEFIYLKIWIDLQNCSSFIRMKKINRRIERK